MKPCGFWHRWQNIFLHICQCMMTRFYIFGKCLLAWWSFQCDCCFTMTECHVCTMNNMPYYTMSVWHVAECRCIKIRCTSSSSLKWVLQSYATPCQFDMWKNANVTRSDVTLHPGNQTPSYRALLHHVCLTCGRMQVYPGQMYIPQLIEPSATELYYRMSVWYVVECRCTQVRCNPPQPLLIKPHAIEP